MLTIVLGAPGSGKTAIATRLRTTSSAYAVIDWDALMPAVESLTGSDVRASPGMWAPYRELLRAVVASVDNVPTVVLGVCTPDELADWPEARWILLDCDDEERRRRLADRPAKETEDAIADAREYRRLGLPVFDTSGGPVEEVANDLARMIECQ
jgi:broad-specificity NMP kinase